MTVPGWRRRGRGGANLDSDCVFALCSDGRIESRRGRVTAPAAERWLSRTVALSGCARVAVATGRIADGAETADFAERRGAEPPSWPSWPGCGNASPLRDRGHWVTPPGRGDPARRRRRRIADPRLPGRVALCARGGGRDIPNGVSGRPGACRSAPAPVHRPRCGNASPLRDRGHWVTHPGSDPAREAPAHRGPTDTGPGRPLRAWRRARHSQGGVWSTRRLSVSTRACSSAPLRECLAPTAERWLSRTAALSWCAYASRPLRVPSRPVESLMALRLLISQKGAERSPLCVPRPRGRF